MISSSPRTHARTCTRTRRARAPTHPRAPTRAKGGDPPLRGGDLRQEVPGAAVAGADARRLPAGGTVDPERDGHDDGRSHRGESALGRPRRACLRGAATLKALLPGGCTVLAVVDESPLDSGLRYFALHCPTSAATSCRYNAARTPNRAPKMKPINPEAAGFPVQLLLVLVTGAAPEIGASEK